MIVFLEISSEIRTIGHAETRNIEKLHHFALRCGTRRAGVTRCGDFDTKVARLDRQLY